jgi:hypothetical protein
MAVKAGADLIPNVFLGENNSSSIADIPALQAYYQ